MIDVIAGALCYREIVDPPEYPCHLPREVWSGFYAFVEVLREKRLDVSGLLLLCCRMLSYLEYKDGRKMSGRKRLSDKSGPTT